MVVQGPCVLGSCRSQKYVLIHMPSRSSQKYPYGLLKTIVPVLPEPLTTLLSLPSIALRLVAKRQSCRSAGVAMLVTGKQLLGGLLGRSGLSALGLLAGVSSEPQGTGAN